jgi:hypothetical protein
VLYNLPHSKTGVDTLATKDVEAFRAALLNEPVEKVLAERVFGGDVFAFQKDQAALKRVGDHLAQVFNASTASVDVIVVGSAKTGFSMDPKNPFRPFHPRSDVDLLVIDSELFDRAWRTLLVWNYSQPERYWPRGAAGPWVGERRDEVWWGYLRPAEWTQLARRLGLLNEPYALQQFGPVRDLSTQWFRTLKGLARDRALSMRDVNARLYRTREHAVLYHIDSLAKLKASVTTS